MEPEVAIVGGGITGTVAATTLARLLPGARITLFDQGRGLGGRASHRRVDNGEVVAPWARSSMAFDHGCQFFQGGDDEFREDDPPLLYHLPTDTGERSPLDLTTHAQRVAALKALIREYEETKVPQVSGDPECPKFSPLNSTQGKWIGPYCDDF